MRARARELAARRAGLLAQARCQRHEMARRLQAVDTAWLRLATWAGRAGRVRRLLTIGSGIAALLLKLRRR